jgi:transcriptional regulator GlxA family with amidase domain
LDVLSRYRLKTVDIVIYPGFKAVEASAICHVFENANAWLAQAGQAPVYEQRIVARSVGFVSSHTPVAMHAGAALNSLSAPDVAVVVGAGDIDEALNENRDVVEWCRSVAARTSAMVGLCSGSFFLAEAGLLDGRRATTHWHVAALLKQRYPCIEVEHDSIFVCDEKIWTSAGVTAGIDLALAMVEHDVGRNIALAVAHDLVVYFKRPGGQSQCSVHLSSQITHDPTIGKMQEWIVGHLNRGLTIGDLARRAAMSERNFTRVFTREAGHTPAVFIEVARIELARRLLQESALPLKSVAAQCGFSSDDHLRHAFRRRCGMTPGAYREYFARTRAQSARSGRLEDEASQHDLLRGENRRKK